PYHNASLESWHGHLKREWVYQFKYKNFEEAYQSIFWYIEAFYNSKRIHQSLGYPTPKQFEKVSADDVVVFAGSAPSNLGNKVYNKLIPLVRETGAQVVCDFEINLCFW
ncbi:IS3 family transposase, partial [Streptococcus thermophilus]|nr:IS3 family transposase [Streptococcus thermophilus]